MEWVETTAKSIDEAKEAALDRLGVAGDEAEFEVVEEPRPGLFGRTRGEARVRARVRPTPVRPKQERRRRSTKDRAASDGERTESTVSTSTGSDDTVPESADSVDRDVEATDTTSRADSSGRGESTSSRRPRPARSRGRGSGSDSQRSSDNNQERTMSNDTDGSPVTPQEVGDAAVAFMDGLTDAFGAEASSSLTVDGTELDVEVSGENLGLLVGPSGRTLNAIQDLVRVSAQRRLGDHETRLRVDVAGYRVRRADALSRFARDVAAQVRESGSARSLEPMSSADRKVIHDALTEEDGVSSRSEGDDPNRRVVVVPD